ncbi:uncharacterized protein [Polyergus mexicanus]|uniref:uncharacterized protein n=1 Tax=Polyergus mexicanus TaxID=615972 RepID=UPI0038B4D3E5
MASLEEPELDFAKPSEEVVRSMKRLYAVPSEKLRIWMVWLTGVGEIADEWHKWLRANIDLIGERLQMVASNVPGDSSKIESVINAKSVEILDNAMATEKEERDVSFNAFNDQTTNDISFAAKLSLKKRVDESPEVTSSDSNAKQGSSTSRTRNNLTTESTGRRTGEGGEEESTRTMTRMATDASETAMETATVWPGTSRQPLTSCPIERKEDQMETIPSLKMPQDEIERIEFLKNFTHQATLYGSYYKHWIETADQAIKEIAGRTVMTTAKFRGTDDGESRLDVAASHPAQYSMKQPESAVAEPIEETTMSGRIDPPTTKDSLERDTVEASIALSDDQSKVVEPSTKKETAEMEAEPASAEPDAASPSVEPDATRRATPQPETTPQMWPTMEPIVLMPSPEIAATLSQEATAKREAAEKLVRDTARAEENIPYFFYLKAEPDIDIAIRYNDEKVIPPDLDRESISANRRRLYFNLTDKLGGN